MRGSWRVPGRDSLAGQSLQLAFGMGAGKALSFLGFVLIARALGPLQYGGFTFALSLGSLLGFIPNMGVDPYYSREVPAGRAQARDLLGTILVLKGVGSAVFLFLYLGIIYLTATSEAGSGGAVFIGIALTLLAITQTWRTVLINSGRAGLAGLLEILPAALFLIATVTLVMRTPTVTAAALGFLLGQVAVVVFGAVVVLRRVGTRGLFRRAAPYLKVFRLSLPLMMIWLLTDLYFRIDITIMHYLRGDADTGLYGASYRLVDGVSSVAMVVCSVSLPRLSGARAVGVNRWREEWSQARRLLLLLVAPLAILLFAGAGPIVSFLYGSRFGGAAQSLRILGPATVLLSFGYLYGAALTSLGLVWMQFRVTVIALAANVFLNLLWIPRFAGAGAAAATLCSALVYLALAHGHIRRGLRI